MGKNAPLNLAVFEDRLISNILDHQHQWSLKDNYPPDYDGKNYDNTPMPPTYWGLDHQIAFSVLWCSIGRRLRNYQAPLPCSARMLTEYLKLDPTLSELQRFSDKTLPPVRPPAQFAKIKLVASIAEPAAKKRRAAPGLKLVAIDGKTVKRATVKRAAPAKKSHLTVVGESMGESA